MLEILLVMSLSSEPAFKQAADETEIVLERKRSHKRRRKIRKPVKGLR